MRGILSSLNYCPVCGLKLQVPIPNFCSGCGVNLKQHDGTSVSFECDFEAKVRVTIHELGERLEECVEKILKSKGFQTER